MVAVTKDTFTQALFYVLGSLGNLLRDRLRLALIEVTTPPEKSPSGHNQGTTLSNGAGQNSGIVPKKLRHHFLRWRL